MPLIMVLHPSKSYRSSNGNDIEAKRSEAKRYFDNRGIFSIEAKRTDLFQNVERSKRSEHYYYYSLQDRSNNEYNQSRICWIEVKTKMISKRLCNIEAKRKDLIQIYARANKNGPCQSKTLEERSKANVIRHNTNKIEEETKISPQQERSESKPVQSQSL